MGKPQLLSLRQRARLQQTGAGPSRALIWKLPASKPSRPSLLQACPVMQLDQPCLCRCTQGSVSHAPAAMHSAGALDTKSLGSCLYMRAS